MHSDMMKIVTIEAEGLTSFTLMFIVLIAIKDNVLKRTLNSSE